MFILNSLPLKNPRQKNQWRQSPPPCFFAQSFGQRMQKSTLLTWQHFIITGADHSIRSEEVQWDTAGFSDKTAPLFFFNTLNWNAVFLFCLPINYIRTRKDKCQVYLWRKSAPQLISPQMKKIIFFPDYSCLCTTITSPFCVFYWLPIKQPIYHYIDYIIISLVNLQLIKDHPASSPRHLRCWSLLRNPASATSCHGRQK